MLEILCNTRLQYLKEMLPKVPIFSTANLFERRVGAVVKVLAFYNMARVRFPDPPVVCGLNLLVLYSALRGFFLVTPVFSSHQKTNI